MLIDMQSFYASVEKAKIPQYKNKPLAVGGDPARRSGIILAACPLAKAKAPLELRTKAVIILLTLAEVYSILAWRSFKIEFSYKQIGINL